MEEENIITAINESLFHNFDFIEPIDYQDSGIQDGLLEDVDIVRPWLSHSQSEMTFVSEIMTKDFITEVNITPVEFSDIVEDVEFSEGGLGPMNIEDVGFTDSNIQYPESEINVDYASSSDNFVKDVEYSDVVIPNKIIEDVDFHRPNHSFQESVYRIMGNYSYVESRITRKRNFKTNY
ncbi:MAG: hypothetical protein QXO37_07045 [Candidatus Nitrosocaldaceae archaeon]